MNERSEMPAAGLMALLDDGAALFETIPDAVFTAGGEGSVGSHFRHVVEFVFELCDGAARGTVDYGRRRRDPLIESDRRAAAAAFRQASERLKALPASDRPLAIVPESFPGRDCATSLLREIDSVQSHTIHHYALVAERLRSFGIGVPEGFGVSPSTLRYRESRA